MAFPTRRPLPDEKPISLGKRHLQVLAALAYVDRGDGCEALAVCERMAAIGDPYDAGSTRSRLSQLRKKELVTSRKGDVGGAYGHARKVTIWFVTDAGRAVIGR